LGEIKNLKKGDSQFNRTAEIQFHGAFILLNINKYNVLMANRTAVFDLK